MYKHYLKHVVLPPGITKKILLVMKLTTLIMCIALMQVSAASLAQKVTLTERNAPLSTVFEQIRTQTGYDFAYTTKTIQSAKPVTISVKNEELADVLKQIFDDQPLDYKIEDKSVTVSVKPPGILDKIKAALNLDKIDVTGKVTDETGQPLAGATVIVKGTNNSTTTAANGSFTLKNVDPKATIVISFIGYDKKEVLAANAGTVRLSVATSKLDEVKVIAYGQTTERLSTGNITTIGSKEIEQAPVSNVLQAIEGRVPGVVITQQSGVPGAGTSVSIQGQNSIQNGNNPFYVIDGVPYQSLFQQNLGGGILGYSGAGATGTAGSPLALINPGDIESISFLKDADATSIYGSRAANGAILITTKTGKAGDTKVDLNFQQGWGDVAHMLDLLSTPQYMQMREEALKNDGITPSLQNGDYDLLLWDTNSYTNWQKKLIGNTAQYTDAQASVSGGTTNVQFLVGGAYHRETTVFPGSFADKKGSVHFSFSTNSKNNKFKVRLTGSYLDDNNDLPDGDFTYAAIRLAPDAPSVYNANGTLNWANDAAGNPTFNNPYASLYNTYLAKNDNLNSNMNLSYAILPGLNLSANLGYNKILTTELQLNALDATPPIYQPIVGNSANYGNNSMETWIVEPQLTYKRNVGRGTFDALLGSTIQQTNNSVQEIRGSGYNSDSVLPDIASAAILTPDYSTSSIYKYNALFGRVGYNWDDEYLLNITVRRDGSSRFGPANEFHDFAAAAAGWIFTKEKSVSQMLPFLSFGKLKASYGSTGNDQIGDYGFLSLYYPFGGQAYQGVKGLIPSGLTNPYLQWELTRKSSFGAELGFLKDHILLNASYSVNRSSNQLLSEPLANVTGFQFITENLPATVENTSWEFALNTINIKNNTFSWSTNINFTIPKNTLVSFPGIAQTSYSSYLVVGQPLGIVKAFDYAGVNPQTGLYQFRDHTGALTSNPDPTLDDFKMINTSPTFYGGISNTIAYRSLSLSFLLQFVKQIGQNNSNFGFVPGQFNGGMGNQPVSVLARWQQPGDNATIQKFNSNFSAVGQFFDVLQSTAAYTDASYMRLKNVSLSWNVPESFIHYAGLKTLRLYLQGQNLITWTKYTGLDPENASSTFLPPLRVCTFGIQAGL